ncbi:hypothetical protein FCM35_KLT19670 [Carex littledalei]|uniref:Uncharacterized protein n=1 Tax=Carex littledalei TaxID=544730 RepID=A0A833R8W3_9POAL|nr:hypothetical protein FCM35_KLT19670 [Carex littledalei]
MVLLNRPDISSQARRANATAMSRSVLDTTYRDSTYTSNLVHIKDRKPERLVRLTFGLCDHTKSLKECGTLVLTKIHITLRNIIPVKTRYRDENNPFRFETDLHKEGIQFLDNLLVPSLRVPGSGIFDLLYHTHTHSHGRTHAHTATHTYIHTYIKEGNVINMQIILVI